MEAKARAKSSRARSELETVVQATTIQFSPSLAYVM